MILQKAILTLTKSAIRSLLQCTRIQRIALQQIVPAGLGTLQCLLPNERHFDGRLTMIDTPSC